MGILHTWIQIKYVPNYIENQYFVLYIITIVFSMSLNIVYLDSTLSIYQSVPYLGVSLFIFGQIIAYLSLFTEPIESDGKRLAKIYQNGIYRYFIHPRLVGEILSIVALICMIVLTPHWFLLIPVFLFISCLFYGKSYSKLLIMFHIANNRVLNYSNKKYN